MVTWTKTETQSEKNFDYITSKHEGIRCSSKTESQIEKYFNYVTSLDNGMKNFSTRRRRETYSQKQSLKMTKILAM